MAARPPIADAAERELRQACAQLDSEIRAGSGGRVETLLEQYPALASESDQIVELILNEFTIRESMGQPVAAAEYFARFPQYRERLQRLFEVDSLLRDSVVTPLQLGDESTMMDGKAPAPGKPKRRRQIGSYEIQESIGSGGMGIVYKAVQLGLNRVVAVKVLRAEADADEGTRARFLREAELAARLHHPNVVQVFEIGEFEGQPFLAMEYVPGRNLHQHLEGQPMAFEAAANLLLTLARTMQYAHDNGVIHRDLKPANILMSTEIADCGLRIADLNANADASTFPHFQSEIRNPQSAIPKIADFGLAIRIDETRMLTAHGQVLGTVTYMAPEQAGGQSHAIAPATDIYSLGAIFYELLTGRPPFLADGYRETIRKVLNEDPVSPRRLMPACSRDLETICLKCLEKEPAKRYATAGQLADDVERFLQSKPILARPVGFVETTIKWTRRRPWTAAFTGVCVAASIALLATIGVYTARLDKAVKRAQEGWASADLTALQLRKARDDERTQRDKTREALDMVTEQVVQDWIMRYAALQPKQRDFLNRIRENYIALAADSDEDDGRAQAGLAEAHRKIGNIHHLLGEYHAAEEQFLVARQTYEALRKKDPSSSQYHINWFWTLSGLCSVYEQSDRLAMAADLAEKTIVELQVLQKVFPNETWPRIGLGQLGNYRAVALSKAGRNAEALTALTEARAHWQALFDKDSEDLQTRMGVLFALQLQSSIAQNGNKIEDARELLRESIHMGEAFVAGDRGNFQYLRFIGSAYVNDGRMASSPVEGERLIRKGVGMFEQYIKAFPNRPIDRLDLARAFSGLAIACVQNRKADAAIAAGERAVAELDKVTASLPHSVEPMVLLGGALCNLGNGYRLKGDQTTALVRYDRGLKVLNDANIRAPAHPHVRAFIGNTYMGRGSSLAKVERFAEAISAFDEALKYPVSEAVRKYVEKERSKAANSK